MTGGKDMLVDFVDSLKSSSDISFGDNSKGKVLGLGKFVISSDASLKNVMLVQSLHYNLLSTIQLACAGYESLFSEFHVPSLKGILSKWSLLGMMKATFMWFIFRKRALILKHA